MKVHIKLIHIISFVIICSCLDIEILNVHIKGLESILYLIRILGIVYIFFIGLKKRHKKSWNMRLIIFFFMLITLISVSQNQTLGVLLKTLSIAFLPAFYLDYYRNSNKLFDILIVWRNILLVLVIIDICTMIIFPYGMYRTDAYSLNWFLGYKTLRLVYSLPLCIIQTYIEQGKSRFIGKKTLGIFLLSILSLFYSKATASAVGLLLIFFIIVVQNIVGRVKYKGLYIGGYFFKKISKLISTPQIVLPVYFIGMMLIINIQKSKLVRFVIENILKKDITLTNRMTLWNNCVELFSKKFWVGYGYLTPDGYREIFNNIYYTSPHNMILTLLITSGIIGFIIYLMLIINSFKKITKDKRYSISAPALGILCILFVGITSSILVFSFCSYIFFIMSDIGDNQMKVSNGMIKKYHLKMKFVR